MKVLFLPWGMATHYFHLVSLAWAFRSAGHEVRVAGQPSVKDAVLGSGMVFAPVAEGYDTNAEAARFAQRLRGVHRNFDNRAMKVRQQGVPTPEVRAAMLKARQALWVDEAVAAVHDLVRLATHWRPDLVVADPLVLAAPLAAASVDAPLVHHIWGPSLPQEVGLPGSGGSPEQWNDDLRALYERFGVEPRTHAARGTVDTCPASLQVPGLHERIPMRYVPYNSTGSVPEWLLAPAERPRVCVTWGTTTTAVGGTENFAVPRILQGLTGHDVDVVLTMRAADRKLLDEVPEGVRVVESLPLHLLLPSCAAIIHQGGYGSLLTAASLGVPQVTAPTMPHLALAARQLRHHGAGVTVDIDEALQEQIAAATATMLHDDTVRAAAGRLREELQAQPTPAETVATLEKLL